MMSVTQACISLHRLYFGFTHNEPFTHQYSTDLLSGQGIFSRMDLTSDSLIQPQILPILSQILDWVPFVSPFIKKKRLLLPLTYMLSLSPRTCVSLM